MNDSRPTAQAITKLIEEEVAAFMKSPQYQQLAAAIARYKSGDDDERRLAKAQALRALRRYQRLQDLNPLAALHLKQTTLAVLKKVKRDESESSDD